MTIHTRFTELFKIKHPLLSAPMGGVAGGKLAATVSNAGALGFVGGGYGDIAWLERELGITAREARQPWGVGLITWKATREMVDLCLRFKPHAFFLSFGDPEPYVDQIKSQGVKVVCQVQDLAGARKALAAGAEVLVAQGSEAGGHGATRGTLPLVAAVVDLAGDTPVLAAGGIADGRGLAAALILGAAGAVMGTRFYASDEAQADRQAKERIIQTSADDTVRTRVFDIARGYDWPEGYTGRAIRNRFTERWHGREDELMAVANEERAKFQRAAAAGDYDTKMIFAGEGLDLIRDIQPAVRIVSGIVRDAEQSLRAGTALLR
jgi:nitronate monooxygenase